MVTKVLILIKTIIVLTLIGSLTSCKSDVSDKTQQTATSVLNVDTLTVQNIQNIRETNSLSSVVTKKYYSLRACLSENSLGQKLDRRNVEVTGTALKSNMTDPSGCIFWDHTFELDYSGQNNCRILSQRIRIPGANIEKTLNYSVDILNDQVDDLSRSKGCTVQAEEKVEASLKNSGGELILEKVNVYWTGEQEEKRSDVKYLSYRSKIESCLKSRVNNTALANTSITITLRDFSGIHEPIIMKNVLTNEAGCFSRQFESPYEQFKYSHWLEKNLNIEVKSGPLANQSTQTQIFLNPYETSRAFFGIDSRWDTPLTNPIKKNNRIHVDGVMYIQIGNDIENFKVNDYLGLTVSKSYQIVLNPRLDLGHRFTRDKPRYVKMHDGRFKLKFMILAPDTPEIEISPDNFQNFTYITGAEKIVTLKDGVINSLINIPVRLTDLPRLATRTVSVFKLEPIDDIGLRDTVVTGFFKAKIAWIKTNVIQDDVLQSTSDELESRYTEKDHQGLVDQVRTQIAEKKADIMNELFIPEKGNIFNSETELLVEDIKRAEYKKYIENLFGNITGFEQKEIFGNPNVFVSDNPKTIFKEHLKKTIPAIQFQDVHATNSENTSVSENEASTQTSNLADFPEGLISDLYTKAENEELSLEDNRFKAFMTILCREAFPQPPKSEGVLTRYLPRGENPEFKLCKSNPNRYFSIDPVMHAKKIEKTNPLYSNGFNMNIQSSFRTSYGEAETQYLSKRVGADAGFKLPLGEYFGMGLKLFDVSYTWSESQSQQQSETDDLSTSKNLVIEKFVVEVEGEFEKCLLVQGKDYTPIMAINPGATGILVPRQMSEYNETVETSFYLCDSPQKQKVLEPWYYIQAHVPSATLLRDAYGPTEIKLIKVLRGENSFKEFKKIFEDETKVYLAQKASNTQTPDEKIYQTWGHLLRDNPNPSIANKLLIKNFEGSFPGTIQ